MASRPNMELNRTGNPSPKNPHGPEVDPFVCERYWGWFSVQSRFPEWVHGKLLLRETTVDNPALYDVLGGTRELSRTAYRRLGCLSGNGIIQLNTGIPTSTEPEEFNPFGVALPESVSWVGEQISVKLKPFQVIMGRYSIQR